MKKIAFTLLFGRDARFNGLMAFAIIGAIALGCTCNKEFGSTSDSPNSSNTSTTSNTTTTDAPPPKPDASTGQVPTDRQALEIARTTLLDFNDAVQSGDFTSFHRTMSKTFQKQASPERLKDAFKDFIAAKVDFREIRTLNAVFSPSPSVEKSFGINNLHLKGYFPTTPRKTNFDLKYIPEGEDWKLIAIEVNTKDQ